MTLTATWTTTQQHRDSVISLFDTLESISGSDVREVLSCTTVSAHQVLEDLMGLGLLQVAPSIRNTTRYILRTYGHDASLVHREWFDRLEHWFSHGRSETIYSTSQQLHLELPETRATLEEMRKLGILYGKFVGAMCIYSLKQRQKLRQATAAQLQDLQVSAEQKLQNQMTEAANTARKESRRNRAKSA
ncbi:hypothetical protein [Deinococcus cellulosilyticus]|uniref:Uncharacterized protein n=1 Tax=Deinococcus cellulosilyticus (strain DSM 18568 / NBRC 106333 / KACC 11606 / 5516J-15) TaxID=1223518 RepID=A0A511N0F6_DEIC1|nr:hypothetical protein [Deinococcus cellulosilyticus]GEM46334.1 hypothetical protein DC3_19690 [Deinococcus cellulosilyticus NBRC 106333 = KACC 11606]